MKIDGEHLRVEDVIRVARYGERVEIDERVMEKVEKARENIEKILKEGKPIYGVNTGFGELANIRIEEEKIKELQENLIRSHSCGTGEALKEEVVRAIMLLRLNSLARGMSGVRYDVLEKIAEALNKRFYPYVPSQGSVGASGDLVQLAHVALSLMGEGEAFYEGKRMASMEVMEKLGMEPLSLEAKEGIALINGTQFMTAVLCLCYHDAVNLIKNAQVAGVMSLEALKGTRQAFREEIAKARPYEGQIKVARNLWKLCEGSEIMESHKNCPKVQDAYSLRCMPQVFGAMYEVLDFIHHILQVEINSATDNPLIFDGDVISGGNFHGEPVALAMDMLNIVLTKISSFSERRIARMLDEKLSELPPFLAKEPGLNSGMMILQYTAASLTSENKSMAYPASVDSIPTSANQEDYQSMGSVGARKCMQILENAERVVSIEYIVASQAIDLIGMNSSPPIMAVHGLIRKHVKTLARDRAMYGDIERIALLLHHGMLLEKAEEAVGKLE